MTNRTTYCRSCSEEIEWVRTRSGKKMPLDAVPSDDGDFFMLMADDGTVEGHHVNGPVSPPDDATFHTSHFATCPEADSWRKK